MISYLPPGEHRFLLLPPLFTLEVRLVYNIWMRIVNARFLKSTDRYDRKRPLIPEIACVGRSNVGKSSMINTLAARKIARTSSTPGATRTINLYEVDYDGGGTRRGLILSDFPGFGYSKVSREMRKAWQDMIEAYIVSNRSIVRLLWVLDVRRQRDDLDDMLLEWLGKEKIPFTMVLTKTDRETRSAAAQKKRSMEGLVGAGGVVLFSSKTGEGKQEVLSLLARSVADAASSL